MRPCCPKTPSSRRGFALVGVLLLVSALAVVASVVCTTTNMGSYLTSSQVAREKAFYAAEAATQEAVWLIKTNPSYILAREGTWVPPVARSFGEDGFSYRYRVVRRADGVYRIEGWAEGPSSRYTATRYYDPGGGSASAAAAVMLCYGREADSAPAYRLYESGEWWAEGSAPDAGSPAWWTVAASCPIRQEKILGVLSSSGRLSAQVWTGSVWSAATLVGSLNVSARGFGIAYETLSGQALLAYSSGPAALGYLTWDGAAWSGPYTLSLPTPGTPRWVRLAANPKSNEIALAWATDAAELGWATWDGATWGAEAAVPETLRTADYECFGLAYEQRSGRGMLVWQTAASSRLSYSLREGPVAAPPQTGPDVKAAVHYVRASADPASNSLLLGTLDANGDIQVWVWDGSAWGEHQKEGGAQTSTQRCFDVCFGYPGGQGLLVWGRSGASRLRYRRWTGSSWEGAKDGPVVGPAVGLVQLAADPYSQRIFAQAENGAGELLSASWDGSAWGSPTEIEALLPAGGAAEPFMLTSGYSTYGAIWRAEIEANERDALSINNLQHLSGVSNPNPHCRFGVFTGGGQVFQSGLEFRLGIPKAAVVKEAYITLTADDANQTGWAPTGPFTASVHVMNEDDAPPFVEGSGHDILHHCSYWSTAVPWTVGLWEPLVPYRTPNLAALVQHVIDRGGWRAGNYIGFAIDQGDATGSSFRSFKDFCDASGQAAKLTVIYSLP